MLYHKGEAGSGKGGGVRVGWGGGQYISFSEHTCNDSLHHTFCIGRRLLGTSRSVLAMIAQNGISGVVTES